MATLELSGAQLNDLAVLVSARKWPIKKMTLSAVAGVVVDQIILACRPSKQQVVRRAVLRWDPVYSNQNTQKPGQWMIASLQ